MSERKCEKCGELTAPQRKYCPKCDNFLEFNVAKNIRRGTLAMLLFFLAVYLAAVFHNAGIG